MKQAYVLFTSNSKDCLIYLYQTQQEFDWVMGRSDFFPESLLKRELKFRQNNKFYSSKTIDELREELINIEYYEGESSRAIGAVHVFYSLKEYSLFITKNPTQIIEFEEAYIT